VNSRQRLVLVAVATAVLAVPPTASASSIVYRKSGRIYAAAPNGTHKHAIKHTRGLSNPSQDDKGRIVAQKGIRFYRLSRRGKRLNKPITTVFRTNKIVPSFKGPFFPEVSPNGKTIVYTYSFTESHFDFNCSCTVTSPSLNTSYTAVNKYVSDPDKKYGHARFYYHSSWVSNSRTVGTTPDLFDYAGNGLDSVEVDPLGGGVDSYISWFTECTSCNYSDLHKYPLDEPEFTRKQDKVVFNSGNLDDTLAGAKLFVYPLAAPPKAIPPHFCTISGPNGKFASPSWSPDGKSLAWADKKGIWVGKLGDLSGTECAVSRKLVIKGGSSPDWGKAKP
jgi:hypothetical protein